MLKPFSTVEICSFDFFWLTIQFELFPFFSFKIRIRMQLTCNFLSTESSAKAIKNSFYHNSSLFKFQEETYELIHKNPPFKLNSLTLTIFNYFSCHPLNCLSCGITSFKWKFFSNRETFCNSFEDFRCIILKVHNSQFLG